MKAWGHFCTITHHKILVMRGCFKIGLYRQGLLHDMSKYSPVEFLVGCKYYQATEVPIMQSGKKRAIPWRGFIIKGETSIIMNIGSTMAWKRGRHYRDENAGVLCGGNVCRPHCCLEDLSEGNYRDEHPLAYYERGAARLGRMIHPDTAALLHSLLKMLAEEGEERTYAYIRNVVLKKDFPY